MRAEVESENGQRPRPVSWTEMNRGAGAGAPGTGEFGTPAEDDQAEWARQEQQVSVQA
jgi:hypothetical protein